MVDDLFVVAGESLDNQLVMDLQEPKQLFVPKQRLFPNLFHVVFEYFDALIHDLYLVATQMVSEYLVVKLWGKTSVLIRLVSSHLEEVIQRLLKDILTGVDTQRFLSGIF